MSKIFKNVRNLVSRGGEVGGTIMGVLGGAATIHYLNEIRKTRIRNKIIIDSDVLEQAKLFKKKMKEEGINNIDIIEVAKDMQIRKNETIQYNDEYKRRSNND